jgi:hypothetical protein
MDEKRTFTDREGIRWSVTEVAPEQSAPPLRERRRFERMATRSSTTQSGIQTRDLMQPWLRFESRGDCRRVEPVPPDWATLSDSMLEDLLSDSRRVDSR